MFKFKYREEIYTLVKIMGIDSGLKIIAFNGKGIPKVFDQWDMENKFTFLDPEICNSELYKAMSEKED